MSAVAGSQVDLLALWAKLGQQDETFRYHPLLFHLLDTVAVAEQLWERALTPRLRRAIADGFGISSEAAGRWATVLVALHDLGKATPDFQFRLPKPKGELEQKAAQHVAHAGFPVPRLPPTALLRHGEALSLVLPPLLRARGLERKVACAVADAVGGHHGRFPVESRFARQRSALDGEIWSSARRHLFELLVSLLHVPEETPRQADVPSLVLLAGLTTVADWIASLGEPYFPYAALLGARPTSDLASYLYRAREAAAAAIDELRWPLPPRLSSAGFRDLFPTLDPPRPLQVAVEGCAAGIPADEPALVVIEAPTGEGKTEAAWLLADRWGIVGSARGVYVAMPTRATSDALFSRVRTILEARYAREDVSAVILQLLHGHAALSAEFTLLREMSRRSAPRELWDDAANEEATRAATVVAGDWFTYRKRGLLAPFGVGTVDQALLAALRVPHNFVRLFGLAGRVVVFDEVHAYDAYMLALFERLVEWLAALRASVVILSATLPQQRLEALVTAFRRGLGQPGNESSPPRARYPRITIVTRAARSSIPVEASALAQRTLTLEAIPLAPDREGFAVLGERLSEAVAEGGCAAVICNTVRQAQECYRVFRDFITGTADDSAPVLDLLHARAPFVWRQEREFRALRRFGKPGGVVIRADGARESVRRPSCAVLVATQIVEQSLDLDFDLLVTLPAPIDLLLQRAGRLHRHQRDRRPGPLAHPRLWCFGPPLDDEKLPIFDRGTLSVYDEHILLRTWITLQVRDCLRLPDEIDELIGSVYDQQPLIDAREALSQRWEQTAQRLQEAFRRERNEAAKRWISSPNHDRLQDLTDADLVEDELELHPALQALTRLGPPTVTIVPLFRQAGGRITVDPDGQEEIDLESEPDLDQVARLLRWGVPVSGERLLKELRSSRRCEQPRSWQRTPLLASVLAAWFEPDGSLPLESGRTLVLDQELGLVDRKEET